MIRVIAPTGNNVLRNALKRVPVQRRHYHKTNAGEVACVVLSPRKRPVKVI